MPDVVLPVLDEAAALPWVLGSLPPGYRPIVVDNGSTDGSGTIARGLGARVVDEPRRGFGAACWAGLVGRERRHLLHGLRRVAGPAGAAARSRAGPRRPLGPGAQPPQRSSGRLAGPRAAGESGPGVGGAATHGSRPARPGADARRAPRVPDGAGDSRPGLRLAA